jgi:hypothetical protein
LFLISKKKKKNLTTQQQKVKTPQALPERDAVRDENLLAALAHTDLHARALNHAQELGRQRRDGQVARDAPQQQQRVQVRRQRRNSTRVERE